MGQDSDAEEMKSESKDFVLVAGRDSTLGNKFTLTIAHTISMPEYY